MARRLAEWPHATWWRPSVRLAALLAPFLTAAILSTARDSVTAATSVLVLVMWVVGAAATGDRLAGVLAAVSAGAWFDFFLTEPYLRFTIADADDIEATVLLVLISLAVSELALWGYRQQKQAARRSGYLDGVLAAARAVAEGNLPPATVVDVVARQISEVLIADSCRYIEGPVRDARIAILDHDGVLTRNGHAVDVERSGLPDPGAAARRRPPRRPSGCGPMTTGLAVVLMAIGLVGMLRAVAIVATGGEGRFALDPLVSIVLGFALILLGQALLGA